MSDEPWYIRIAEDPQGSLERLAERRGMTVEQLNDRHDKIAKLFSNDTYPDFFEDANGDTIILRSGMYEITIGDNPHKAVYFQSGYKVTEQITGRTDENDNPVFVRPVVHRRME